MNPVRYTPEHQAIVDAYNRLPDAQKTADYWNSDEINPIRKLIKDHYIAEQRQRCCHCNMDLRTGNNAVWDAEHIISKNLHPKFIFEPLNLAVSCKDCNIAKDEKEVRKNKRRKTFPRKSPDYTIVHPHFDDYNEHIRWYGDVCRAMSDKGENTIIICRLTRFAFAKVGADNEPPMATAYDKQIGTLVDPRSSILEKEMALAALQKFLDDAKKKNPKASR